MKESQENPKTGINRILVEFDVVVDIDLAIMKLVQEKFNNPKFIRQDIMSLSLHDVKEELLNRKYESPLSICIDDIKSANSLYKEFLENKYNEILEFQTATGIFKLMEVYHKTDGMKVTILCSSKEEADVINSYGNFNVLIKKHDEVNINDYDIYFIKSLPRIYTFEGRMENKHIFVMGYKYNLVEDKDGMLLPNPMIVRSLIPANRVGIVDVYPVEEKIRLRKNSNIDKTEDTENAE